MAFSPAHSTPDASGYQDETRRDRFAEERLRMALDSVHAAACEWAPQTGECFWPDELWKLLDLEPQSCEPSLETWLRAIHPDDREAAAQAMQEAATTGSEFRVEARVCVKSGGIRWILARGCPAGSGDGAEGRFIGIVLDITQRKLSEEAGLEREQSLRQFTEAAPVAIAMLDRQLRYVATSRRFREQHGSGFPGPTDKWRAIKQRCLAGSTERHPGERFVYADGTEHWVKWEIQPWRDARGEVAGLMLFWEDISEQKRAEIAAERWQRAFEQTELAIALGDPADLTLQVVNESFARQRGYSPGEMVQRPIVELFPAAERDALGLWLQIAGQQGHVTFESQHERKDGSTFPVQVDLTVVRNSAGEAVSRVAFVHDLTAQKQAEQQILSLNNELEQRVRDRTAQLEAANRELEAFSYSVSHDLRAPLRAIDGWSLALAEDYGEQLDGTAKEYLCRVREGARQMGSLIDDLLQLSRVSRCAPEATPVDLSAMAAAIAAQLRETRPECRMRFQIEPGLTTRGDSRFLKIALNNLLDNAAKFSSRREEALIEFFSCREDGAAAFCVRDNGAGFEMAHAGHLFNPFHRLHAGEFPGNGIGLAIVQRVIRRHGGRVWAQARVGEGASFYFTIEASA